jgi:hypothetical protein
MERTAVFALIIFSAGCTAANPDYVPPDGSVGTQRDLAMGKHVDLAMQLAPDLSMPPPPACQGADRSCTPDSAASELCANSSFQIDRTCPGGSMCQGGYCQVPPPGPDGIVGNPCTSEADCAAVSNLADSCQPFVVDPNADPPVEWHCASSVGDGASGTKCQDGSTCRSGFCIAATSTCFRACTDDLDCPVRLGVKTVCRPEMITVEGVAVTANSCIFP